MNIHMNPRLTRIRREEMASKVCRRTSIQIRSCWSLRRLGKDRLALDRVVQDTKTGWDDGFSSRPKTSPRQTDQVLVERIVAPSSPAADRQAHRHGGRRVPGHPHAAVHIYPFGAECHKTSKPSFTKVVMFPNQL